MTYGETSSPKWKSRTAPAPQKPKVARPEKRPSADRRQPPPPPSPQSSGVHRAAYARQDRPAAYTGMDREIVEEFISVTMDPKHYRS